MLILHSWGGARGSVVCHDHVLSQPNVPMESAYNAGGERFCGPTFAGQPHLQGGQALLTLITESISQLSDAGLQVNLRPPIDDDRESTSRAHNLVHNATEPDYRAGPAPWARVKLWTPALRWTRANAKEHRKSRFRRATTDQLTRWLGSVLPGLHTKILHDSLDRERASIPPQLRTGHARLNLYLHRIGEKESDIC